MGNVNTDVSRKPNQQPVSNDSQFIDQAIQTKLSDQFRPYYLISAMIFIFTLFEWYRWQESLPPVPFMMSILFLISVVIAYVKQQQFKQELGFLSTGKRGEKLISEYINDLSKDNNIRVFRDVKIEGNFCSYLVCANFGVMAIEIIDLPVPQNGEAIVAYKNNNLTLNGYPIDRDPVDELKGSCEVLKKLLQKSSNKNFTVHGVLVFPNWYVESHDGSDIKIINPRQLGHVYKALLDDDVIGDQGIASYHINKFIRASNL